MDRYLNPRCSLSIANTKGLLNAPGDNNCFLNSAIQVLWNLDVFRKSFRLIHGHACMQESCIFCALKVLFTQFQYSEAEILPPDALRKALAKSYADQQIFKLGCMDDAAECLEKILQRIHFHIAHDEKEDMCNVGHCITHQKFALTIIEQCFCSACGATSEPFPFTELVHYVSTSALCAQARLITQTCFTGGTVPFGRLLKIACAVGDSRNCPSNCGEKIEINRVLMNTPDVVTIGLIWDSDRASSEQTKLVLQSIGTTLKVEELFHKVIDSDFKQTTFNLAGLVTYYGKHYSTFFYRAKQSQWIYFDDANFRQVGHAWSSVVDMCIKGRYQPLLLIYANPSYELVDISSAPTLQTYLTEYDPPQNPDSMYNYASQLRTSANKYEKEMRRSTGYPRDTLLRKSAARLSETLKELSTDSETFSTTGSVSLTQGYRTAKQPAPPRKQASPLKQPRRGDTRTPDPSLFARAKSKTPKPGGDRSSRNPSPTSTTGRQGRRYDDASLRSEVKKRGKSSETKLKRNSVVQEQMQDVVIQNPHFLDDDSNSPPGGSRGHTTPGPSDRGYNSRSPSDRGKGPSDRGYYPRGPSDQGYDSVGYSSQGYNSRGPSVQGYNSRSPSVQGYNSKDPNEQRYNPRAPSEQGYHPRAPSEQGYHPRAPSEQGYHPRSPSVQQDYTARGASDQGYNSIGYSSQGYSTRGPSVQGYNPGGPSEQGYHPRAPSEQGYYPRRPSDLGFKSNIVSHQLSSGHQNGSAIKHTDPTDDPGQGYNPSDQGYSSKGPSYKGYNTRGAIKTPDPDNPGSCPRSDFGRELSQKSDSRARTDSRARAATYSNIAPGAVVTTTDRPLVPEEPNRPRLGSTSSSKFGEDRVYSSDYANPYTRGYTAERYGNNDPTTPSEVHPSGYWSLDHRINKPGHWMGTGLDHPPVYDKPWSDQEDGSYRESEWDAVRRTSGVEGSRWPLVPVERAVSVPPYGSEGGIETESLSPGSRQNQERENSNARRVIPKPLRREQEQGSRPQTERNCRNPGAKGVDVIRRGSGDVSPNKDMERTGSNPPIIYYVPASQKTAPQKSKFDVRKHGKKSAEKSSPHQGAPVTGVSQAMGSVLNVAIPLSAGMWSSKDSGYQSCGNGVSGSSNVSNESPQDLATIVENVYTSRIQPSGTTPTADRNAQITEKSVEGKTCEQLCTEAEALNRCSVEMEKSADIHKALQMCRNAISLLSVAKDSRPSSHSLHTHTSLLYSKFCVRERTLENTLSGRSRSPTLSTLLPRSPSWCSPAGSAISLGGVGVQPSSDVDILTRLRLADAVEKSRHSLCSTGTNSTLEAEFYPPEGRDPDSMSITPTNTIDRSRGNLSRLSAAVSLMSVEASRVSPRYDSVYKTEGVSSYSPAAVGREFDRRQTAELKRIEEELRRAKEEEMMIYLEADIGRRGGVPSSRSTPNLGGRRSSTDRLRDDGGTGDTPVISKQGVWLRTDSETWAGERIHYYYPYRQDLSAKSSQIVYHEPKYTLNESGLDPPNISTQSPPDTSKRSPPDPSRPSPTVPNRPSSVDGYRSSPRRVRAPALSRDPGRNHRPTAVVTPIKNQPRSATVDGVAKSDPVPAYCTLPRTPKIHGQDRKTDPLHHTLRAVLTHARKTSAVPDPPTPPLRKESVGRVLRCPLCGYNSVNRLGSYCRPCKDRLSTEWRFTKK